MKFSLPPVLLVALLTGAGLSAAAADLPGVPAYVKAGPAPDRKPVEKLAGGPLGVERVASAVGTAPYYIVKGKESLWLQIDLGKPLPIEAVKLYSFAKDKIDGKPEGVSPDAFPKRFRIDVSDEPGFETPRKVADHTEADFKLPFGHMPVLTFPAAEKPVARYVRLTVTQTDRNDFMLWRFEVISDGQDAATGARLSDSIKGDLGQHALLRPRRPVGEGVVLDRPEQATDPATWQPPQIHLKTPRSGVTVGGLFKERFDHNVRYLLDNYTAEDYTRKFYARAGKPAPPAGKQRSGWVFWMEILPNSCAGRFLMGAGNALRWQETPELRERLNTVVSAVKECARDDGYIMAFPEETILTDQHNGYDRSWICNGLVEAGIAGNPDAFGLLRRWGDWFNTCPYLPEMAFRVAIGWQGMIANSRTYVDTPVGAPADIQVLQRHFQLDYWLRQLAEKDPAALWNYPYDRTHSYLIVTLNAYADMYAATGDRRYLDAVRGAWETIREDFEHPGGGITLIEDYGLMARRDLPKAYRLRVSNSELCGNVFHAYLSQQLRNLYPEDERYAAGFERDIYNVALANQGHGASGFRYHARLLGRKENPGVSNTCCEGQGTRLLGSLPEFIYKLADDGGVYVDLFSESAIAWTQTGGGPKVTLAQSTKFPHGNDVSLRVSVAGGDAGAASPTFKLRVRVPAWVAAPVAFSVNGAPSATGKPGSYVTLDRRWAEGDTVTFSLPPEFRLTRYPGTEEGFAGKEAYALECGPFLMALCVPDAGVDEKGKPIPGIGKDNVKQLPLKAADLVKNLRPVAGKPLHFSIEGLPEGLVYAPYFEVQGEAFTCYPFFEK